MSKPITVLRDTHPLPVLDACKWEKLEGDPHTVNLNAYTSEDGSKIMGTWICTPGKWYVEYVKWEYCHFQEGYCVITLKAWSRSTCGLGISLWSNRG